MHLCQLTFNSKKTVKILYPLLLISLLMGFFIYRAYFPHKRIPIALLSSFFFSFLVCLIPYFYFMNSKWFKSRLFFFSLATIVILFLISSKMEHALFHSRVHFNFLLNESDIIKSIRLQQKNEIIPKRVALFKSVHNYHHYAIYLNYHGLHTVDGIYSLYSGRYSNFFKTLGKPMEKYDLPYARYTTELHSYLPGSTYYTDSHFTYKAFNENLLALMNVKYIFSTLPIKHPDQFGLSLYYDPKISNHFELNNCSQYYKKHVQNILQEINLTHWLSSLSHLKEAYTQCRSYYWVYTLNQTIPRVFITPQVEILNDKELLLQVLSKKNTKELMQSSLFLKNDIEDTLLPTSEKSFQWSLEPVTYTPDYIKIKVFSEKKGVLILTDNYHPKWHVYVNGIKSKIFPSYYTFRGVVIPEGHSSVEFKYEDPVLSVTYIIMGIGLLGLIMMVILNPRSFQDSR